MTAFLAAVATAFATLPQDPQDPRDGVHEPTWESLDARPTPAWFPEAKFGIFIHWGVYSVPSWSPKGTYAEWYWKWMEDKPEVRAFHDRVYGPDFDYRAFAPRFTAELFDPDAWAKLFAASGARYVVLTSKHHDGFCLWPAPDSEGWNSVENGPKRDLVGDLAASVREAGLRFGVYYSLYEWYHPLYGSDLPRYVEEHVHPQFRDLVTRYEPAIVFSDGEWEHSADEWRSRELLDWLYDESPAPADVVANDRWGKDTRGRHGDYFTTEYGRRYGAPAEGYAVHAWEENRGIGASYGYNRNESLEDYATPEALVRLLAQTAAAGGNLLLDVGPTADGRIPVIQEERLRQIGAWLGRGGNGAIFGSTAGPFRSFPWGAVTRTGDRLNLIVVDWPEGPLELTGLATEVEKAWPVGRQARKSLVVEESEDGPRIHLSAVDRDPVATVIAVQLAGEPEVRRVPIRPDATGRFVLPAADALLAGETLRLDGTADVPHLVGWRVEDSRAAWTARIPSPGRYEIEVSYSSVGFECHVGVSLAGEEVVNVFPASETSETFFARPCGWVEIDQAGPAEVVLRATVAESELRVREVRLIPARDD